jgi:Domain of unknown function (DUF4142)
VFVGGFGGATIMRKSSARPAPGSRPEAVSSIIDKVGGAAGIALAATSIRRKQFIQHAVIANLYEVEAAKIALQRARRNGVKEVARAMLADHKKMGSELLSFIGGTNAPQSPPESLDTVHRMLIDNLHGVADRLRGYGRRHSPASSISATSNRPTTVSRSTCPGPPSSPRSSSNGRPQWSNAIERDRARTYFQAYCAAAALLR